jgi:2-oxoglutarate dehydrogenase E1 component
MESTRNRPAFSSAGKTGDSRKAPAGRYFLSSFCTASFLARSAFSLEGGETLIPLLHSRGPRPPIARTSRDLVLGMAHRGRLNVLANIFCKPLETIFRRVPGQSSSTPLSARATSNTTRASHATSHPSADQASCILSLASNPSHLEAVDPVVVGKSRARQDYYNSAAVTRSYHGPHPRRRGLCRAGHRRRNPKPLATRKATPTGGTLHIVTQQPDRLHHSGAPRRARPATPRMWPRCSRFRYSTCTARTPRRRFMPPNWRLEYRNRFAKDAVVDTHLLPPPGA